jgi:hypothetical protein
VEKLKILCGRIVLTEGLIIFILLGVHTAKAQKAKNGKSDEQVLRDAARFKITNDMPILNAFIQ